MHEMEESREKAKTKLRSKKRSTGSAVKSSSRLGMGMFRMGLSTISPPVVPVVPDTWPPPLRWSSSPEPGSSRTIRPERPRV